MKQKILELTAFILFTTSVLSLFGTAGAMDLNRITLGQAVLQLIIGLAVLGLSIYLINHLVKEASGGQDSTMSDL